MINPTAWLIYISLCLICSFIGGPNDPDTVFTDILTEILQHHANLHPAEDIPSRPEEDPVTNPSQDIPFAPSLNDSQNTLDSVSSLPLDTPRDSISRDSSLFEISDLSTDSESDSSSSSDLLDDFPDLPLDPIRPTLPNNSSDTPIIVVTSPEGTHETSL